MATVEPPPAGPRVSVPLYLLGCFSFWTGVTIGVVQLAQYAIGHWL